MENSNLNSFQQEGLYGVLVSAAQAEEQFKMFSMLKPKLFQDGNQWCCLYGENIIEGIVGFGESPVKAISQWNNEWYNQLPKEEKK